MSKVLNIFSQSKPSTIFPGSRNGRRSFRSFPWAASTPSSNIWHSPSLSIVIPVYNHAAYLRDCIPSILENSPEGVQIIVVNDGSTDNFSEVIESFRALPNFLVIEQENQGISSALNRGIEEASGVFLSWQSADNLVCNQAYHRLLNFIIANPTVEIAYGDVSLIDETGRALKNSGYRPQDQEFPEAAELKLPCSGSTLATFPDNFVNSAFIFRRSTLCATQGYQAELLGAEDYAVALELARYGEVAHCDSSLSLGKYRLHSETLSQKLPGPEIELLTKKLLDREKNFPLQSSELQIEHNLSGLPAQLLQQTSANCQRNMRLQTSKICLGLKTSLPLVKFDFEQDIPDLQPGSGFAKVFSGKDYSGCSWSKLSTTPETSQQPGCSLAPVLKFLSPLELPPELRRARDSWFQALPLDSKAAATGLVIFDQRARAPEAINALQALNLSCPEIRLALLCPEKLAVREASLLNEGWNPENKLPILDISEQYAAASTDQKPLSSALLYLLSSVDLMFSFAGGESLASFLELRTQAGLAALAGIPIVSLGSQQRIIPRVEEFAVIPHLTFLHGQTQVQAKLINSLESLEIGSFEQWLQRQTREALVKRLRVFLTSHTYSSTKESKLSGVW